MLYENDLPSWRDRGGPRVTPLARSNLGKVQAAAPVIPPLIFSLDKKFARCELYID